MLLLSPEIHQYFVLYALGGIGSKTRSVVNIEGIYRLYEPDSTNRYEILLIFAR